MQALNNFYTIDTLLTLTGSATAVWIITSVVGYLLEPRNSEKVKKWLGLFLSLVLALLGATTVQEQTLLTWLVAVVNGFVIYLTAVGANTIRAQTTNGGETAHPFVRETGASRKRARGNFTEPWW